jgi:siroheme decarboxylase
MSLPRDDLDRALLNAIQQDFPLAVRPFAVLAGRLGSTEADVLERCRWLHHGPQVVIRQISAIFDTRKMGYDSMLVAFQVPPDRIEAAARELNRNPGVSHNYERNAQFNVWFTIAVPPPPDSRLTLEETVERLAKKVGATSYQLLPTLKLYKIGVQLDVEKGARPDARNSAPTPRPGHKEEVAEVRERSMPSAWDREVIRELQKDLEITERPFQGASERLAITEEKLIQEAERLIAEGRMRRYAAVLKHQAAGFVANGMAVWKVPAERADEVGRQMGSFQAVSHCYKRPTGPAWPYSHFTMIHGRNEGEVEAVAKAISEETGITEYQILYSTREFKKTRVPYFVPEYAKWESELLST